MAQSLISRSAVQIQRRAILKTLGYRVFMLIITITVAWGVIGDLGMAIDIGIIANVAKTGTYYLYERTWDHITWGLATPT